MRACAWRRFADVARDALPGNRYAVMFDRGRVDFEGNAGTVPSDDFNLVAAAAFGQRRAPRAVPARLAGSPVPETPGDCA